LLSAGALLANGPSDGGLGPGCDASAQSVGAGGVLPSSARPLSSTGTRAGGGDGCESKAQSQDSSRSTFWCAAFQKARISSSSRPAGKACCLTASVSKALRCSALG